MSESATAIAIAIVVTAIGGYLGYRICKEKEKLARMVAILGPHDASLLASIDALIAQGELEPTPG